jgi:hypothetical protein
MIRYLLRKLPTEPVIEVDCGELSDPHSSAYEDDCLLGYFAI